MAKISVGVLELDGALLEGDNPLPLFRNRKHDTDVQLREGFPDRYKALLGSETGFRILPYTRQDRYTRNRKKVSLKTIILENDQLRAVFLPEYGARLYSLVSKKDGRELLYRNEVFQSANLAIRNAWFSGGIEWNVGHYGHSFTTCESLFCSIQKDGDGNDFLRVYEYERCKGLFWHIDFHLDEGSSLLYAYSSVHNPDAREKSMYWWTNIAVSQEPGSRVFSPTPDVIYLDPYVEKGERRFGFGSLPELDVIKGIDATYPGRLTYSNEYFFTCDAAKLPWEASLGSDGKGLFEVSTDMLKYRKMFCWGTLPGSKRWSEFLSQEGDRYFEIQAGLAPTQLHGMQIPAETAWSWTQAFGLLEADPEKVQDADWSEAQKHVASNISARVSVGDLNAKHAKFREAARVGCGRILHSGSGWGALEVERRRKAGLAEIPVTFGFPRSSMGPQQKPWLALLQNGKLPAKKGEDLPWSFIVQDEWEELLGRSVDAGGDWNALLHLGVMAMEKGDVEKARLYWERSIALSENAWAYRNLACAQMESGNSEAAVKLYAKAVNSPGYFADRAIAEEYLTLLVSTGKLEEARSFYRSLDKAWKAASDVLAVQYAFLCVRTGNIEEAEAFLLRDIANIRECETPLSDIWFEIEALKYAKERNVPLTDPIRLEIRKTRNVPAHLDFRMI